MPLAIFLTCRTGGEFLSHKIQFLDATVKIVNEVERLVTFQRNCTPRSKSPRERDKGMDGMVMTRVPDPTGGQEGAGQRHVTITGGKITKYSFQKRRNIMDSTVVDAFIRLRENISLSIQSFSKTAFCIFQKNAISVECSTVVL